MDTLRMRLFLLFVFAAIPGVATSQETTFSINLEGDAQETGHHLRAFGTITVDLRFPALDAVRTSQIFIQHEADEPIQLNPLPGQGGINPSSGLQWEIVDDRLYINRISTLSRIIQWNTAASVPQFTSLFFESGPPNNPHGMFYRFGGHDDTVLLKPGSPPDGPQGFLVGVRIPEPSSLVMLMCGGALLATKRIWRR